MKLTNLVLVLASGALAAGCQVARTSEEDRTQALEQRVRELEQQLTDQAAPALDATPAPAAAPAPKTAVPRAASRPPVPKAAPVPQPRPARSASTTPGPAPAPAAVEPLPPAVEPVVSERPAAPRVREPEWVLPRGTRLSLMLQTPLSSRDSQAGDEVVARIEEALADGEDLDLPSGALLYGRVIDVRSSGRVKGRARVTVEFERIAFRGQNRAIETTVLTAEAQDGHEKDAAVVGGGTLAGVLIGAIAGGKKGAAKGAAIGAAAGAGTVLATKGEEVELSAGSRWTVELLRRLRL